MMRSTIALAVLLLTACASTATRPLQYVGGDVPVYPPAAKAQGIQGYVVVAYDVTAEGRVVNARVIEAEPEGVFDEAAVRAIASWRFNAPITKGVVEGAPNRSSRVEFKLGDGAEYVR